MSLSGYLSLAEAEVGHVGQILGPGYDFCLYLGRACCV